MTINVCSSDTTFDSSLHQRAMASPPCSCCLGLIYRDDATAAFVLGQPKQLVSTSHLKLFHISWTCSLWCMTPQPQHAHPMLAFYWTIVVDDCPALSHHWDSMCLLGFLCVWGRYWWVGGPGGVMIKVSNGWSCCRFWCNIVTERNLKAQEHPTLNIWLTPKYICSRVYALHFWHEWTTVHKNPATW